MHGEQIYYSDQNLIGEPPMGVEGTNTHFQNGFKQFIREFSRENKRIYHQQLASCIQQNKYHLNIQLADLKASDEHLYEKFISNPLDTLPVMDSAVKDYVFDKQKEFTTHDHSIQWHVIVLSDENPQKLRDIGSSMVSKIFVVGGIIISTTKPYIKATKLKIKCKSCGLTRSLPLLPGQTPYVPSFCTGQNGVNQKCPNDPFVAMPDSQVTDTQNLRIQQNPEEIPTGQIARTYSLIADRYNVNRCVPGDRVRITGVMLVQNIKTEGLSKGSLYVTGVQKIKERTNIHYGEEEVEQFKRMAKDPKIYQKIYKSIAPGIYGNQEIKKAIACMLFGGARKHLPDHTILRGDINVLLLGDPSTAKSQFLKFVEQAATIAVYTSGKGSSAAGLTASITKDTTTGQFQIQGGALVLADGGIVCIDEFDKMKSSDRVAIHEAMEQQTISIAKAGITTRLNSRVSILAAANPVFGRYDDMKEISQQIELQTTILSRFDCIFIVRDINTNENNLRVATHVLDLHQGKVAKIEENKDFPFQILKKYINYARQKVSPRLSSHAAEKLQAIYVSDRQKALEQKKANKNSFPITVRQLQAIIRLSQSLAKMKLKTEVTSEDVDEAHYIFEVSTMKSIEGTLSIDIPQNIMTGVQKVEDAIRKRVCVGNQVSAERLRNDLSTYDQNHFNYAISNMLKNGDLRQIKGKKHFIRDK